MAPFPLGVQGAAVLTFRRPSAPPIAGSVVPRFQGRPVLPPLDAPAPAHQRTAGPGCRPPSASPGRRARAPAPLRSAEPAPQIPTVLRFSVPRALKSPRPSADPLEREDPAHAVDRLAE